MPFIVTSTRTPTGKYVVDNCPSCGKRHVHREAGTIRARCGMTYFILPPAPPVRRGRR